ncbi:MAG: glycosyltransferase [Candidatus Riflebacteria bacterium]|nr:glycosyltransferase [Candidatus Riflebacteria bacterium]
MKILQAINALTWGGAQTLLLDLCRFLAAQGHEVRVAAFRDGPVGEALRRHGHGVEILGEVCFDLVAFARLRRLVAVWQPDVVHSHLGRATFWARLVTGRPAGPPLVTSVHGFEADGFHRLERRMACHSGHLVFPSRFLAGWYAEHLHPLPAHRWSVIPPGAAIQPLPPAWEHPAGGGPAGGPGGSPPVMGALARLHPVKGLDTLIAAAGLLHQEGLPFRLVIGGDGRELARLRGLIERHHLAHRTTLGGPVATRASFLESLDLFVAPSREEAFGISICEAMERGVPVVATAVGGIPEIVRDGVDGRLVPPDDPPALAAALRPLLQDGESRRRAGAAGRLRVESVFPRERALEAHLALYSRLAAGSLPPRRLHLAISSPELGGGERVALAVGEALHRRGWTVTSTCGGEPLAGRLRAAGLAGRAASLKAGGLFFALRLWSDLRRTGAGLVSAHLNRAALVAALVARLEGALGRDRQVVAHVHGLNRAVYYRSCRHLVAVSAAVRDHLLAQGVPAGQVTLLPNCIPAPAMARERAPGPPWTIGIVAKLHVNKGHLWALEALEQGRDRLPEFRVWILGDGPERQSLENRFGSGPLASRLTFWGFRDDLDRFYPDLHLVLLPSHGEGIPLSLLEAMRWGIPCVATRVGGIPEIVTDGANGLLVEPGRPQALVEAIVRATTPGEWSRLAAGARAHFAAVNRFGEMIDRFEAILQTLATEERKG